MYVDALICPVIVGDRRIQSSLATSLFNPVLTRAEGYLYIRSNNVLARVDFASLSYVGSLHIQTNNVLTRVEFASLTYIGDYLDITDNNALTFASLPRLSQVQREIGFCLNAPLFVIPNPASGTAAPPGLTSVQLKGQVACRLQPSSLGCSFRTCP